jgi:hypothetical protein
LFLPLFNFHLGYAKCLDGMRSCPSVSLPAIVRGVIRRLLNSETRIHFRTRPYGIYDGQIGTGTSLSPSSSVLSLKGPYTNGLHSNFIDRTRSVAVVITTWLSNLIGASLANCPYGTTFTYFTCTQG